MAAAEAAATGVTTNAYYDAALGNDIAESCKAVEIDSSSAEVDAECNKQGESDDNIYPVDTSYDVDELAYCQEDSSGLYAALTFGSGPSETPVMTWTAESWSVSVSTDGKNYIVSATCKASTVHQYTSSINLGDTTKGLKNEGGTLKKR